MQRRDFLRKGLLLGTAALLPGAGIAAKWDAVSAIEQPLLPIWEAAVGGHWSIVKEWLRLDPTLINVTGKATLYDIDYKKASLLHLATALNPDVGLLQYLVSLGADVNAMFEARKPSDGGGYETLRTPPPIYFAVLDNSNVDILRFLVSPLVSQRFCEKLP